MSSPSRGLSDRAKSAQGTSAPENGPLDLVRRILHRKEPADAAELSLTHPTQSGSSATASKPTVVERLEGFFTQDLPSEMQVLPTEDRPAAAQTPIQPVEASRTQRPATPPQTPEQTGSANGPSEFVVVRSIRLAAKDAISRIQEAHREVERDLKLQTDVLDQRRAELLAAADGAAAKLREAQARIAKDLTDELEKVSQEFVARSAQQLQERSDATLTDLNERLAGERQRFVAETEKQFEELRGSRQAFVADTQKQLASTILASMESLAGTAIEKARPELERLKDAALAETQKQIATASATVESGSKDLTDLTARARAEFEGLKDAALAETQKQIATASATVESGSKDLTDLTARARAELEGLKDAALAETQKQIATTSAAVESGAKDLTDLMARARAELEGLKDAALADTQKQIATTSATVESGAKDLTNLMARVRAELEASKAGFIEGTQDRFAELAQSSHQSLQEAAKATIESAYTELTASRRAFLDETKSQAATAAQAPLESMVKRAAEKGRDDLRLAVEEVFALRKPQIESELNNLAVRLCDSLRSHASYASASVVSRPAPVREVTPETSRTRALSFTLAESGTKPRIDAREILPSLAWGLKLGLGFGLAILLLLGIYLYASPVVRLRPGPPSAFFGENPSWTAKQRAREEQLARSYWDIAVRDIQTNYGFGTTLPADPPDNFAVEEKLNGALSKVDAAARARYWEKLRDVWSQADSWEKVSSSGFGSIRNAWASASSKIAQMFSASHSSAAPTR